jgi:molybdenum cofactor biosynthesis enzyme MoaA
VGKLEEIGFYTLSDERAAKTSESSPLRRCELVLTDRCNLKCPYCRGLPFGYTGDVGLAAGLNLIALWAEQGLDNIRFSGGEPMLHPHIENFVRFADSKGIQRIAVSTNGTLSIRRYERLVSLGANDFSISLDAGCCATGDAMAGGVPGAWAKAAETIRRLARITYVTVGMVFTEANAGQAMETVLFADSLGPSDIRIIPSAQYNRAVKELVSLPKEILAKYPILRYRIGHMAEGRNVRGIGEKDSRRCAIAMDDIAVAGGWHFPCIIYLREHGKPIGKADSSMRRQRHEWSLTHDTHEDPVCRGNCIDCVVDFNNKWEAVHGK